MNTNKQMIPYKKSFIEKIQSAWELVKARFSNKYTLNEKSPDSLKGDINLIIRTISIDKSYINKIDLSILKENSKSNKLLYNIFQLGITLEDLPQMWLKDKIILNKISYNYLRLGKTIESILNYYKSNNIKKETIIDTLCSNESSELIKLNQNLLNDLLDHIGSVKASDILNKLYSDEEIQDLFHQKELPHNLQRLKELYEKDPRIIKDIDTKLLSKRYDTIETHKIQLFARIPKIQSKILSFDDFNLALYSRMSKCMSSKVNNWFEYDNNLIQNLSSDNYKDLIDDLKNCAINGDKINQSNIETLTNMLSSMNDENIFNITSKAELEEFDRIKEQVCSTIFENPELNDENIPKNIANNINSFKMLSPVDRVKTALLQKNYNLSLKEANYIINSFGRDINDIPIKSEEDGYLVEIVTALKNICECNDLNTLINLGQLENKVNFDLSNIVILQDKCKELYGKLFQENLYQPSLNDLQDSVEYNGKQIKVYKPDENFKGMVVKRIGVKDQILGTSIFSFMNDIDNSSYKNAWNDLGENIRFRTSVSYMTPETLLSSPHGQFHHGSSIIFGFSDGIGNSYKIDEIYTQDSATRTKGDVLSSIKTGNKKSEYRTPDNLDEETGCNLYQYNELVVNTFSSNNPSERLQPSYIVYISKKPENEFEKKLEEKHWKESLEAAEEFNIPIVVLDQNKIMQSQIDSIIQNSNNNEFSEKRLLAQIRHFSERYGIEKLNKMIPEELISKAQAFIDENEYGKLDSKMEGEEYGH